MGSVRIRVEHALGRDEARARIQGAAAGLTEKSALVRSIAWTEDGAQVAGDGFDGRLSIGDTEVVGEVELGWKLAFFPLKVRRDAEAWLQDLLK
jgi:putative polyhydroxyalkanoate system protein